MSVNRSAFLLMIAGASLIPLGDAIAKFAHQQFGTSIIFLAWSRFSIGAVICVPVAVAAGARLAEMRHPWVIFRGLLIAVTISLILQAAARAPLADAYGAFFVAPLVSFILAVVFLREQATRARWIAMLAGFIGVLMVVRPGLQMADGMVLGLVAGLFYGSFLTTNRYLSPRFSAWSMLQAQLLIGTVVLLPLALPLTTGEGGLAVWFWITLSAVTSLIANLLMVLAYARAPATRLAPLIYVQIIAATFYGAIFFGVLPDTLTWAGLAVLVVSGSAGLLWRNASGEKA